MFGSSLTSEETLAAMCGRVGEKGGRAEQEGEGSKRIWD